MFNSDEELDRAFKFKEKEWKDLANYGAKVIPIKATFKNQIVESVCDLDDTQFPSLKGSANKFNEHFQ